MWKGIGKTYKQDNSKQAHKIWCLFEDRLLRICVYKRGIPITYFVENVAESDGFWIFKACQIGLLSKEDQLTTSWNLIINVMWNTHRQIHTHTHTLTHR